MDNSKNILARIKQAVLSKYPNAQLYLYGSRATGKATDISDWDILILLNQDNLTPEIEDSVKYPLYDLEFETGNIISPMIYSLKEWHTKFKITPFYKNVMNQGILL